MDDKNKELREQIRKEVIAELMPTYQAALEDLKIKVKIITEKEKVFDYCFKSLINKLAVDNAIHQTKEEMQQQNAGAISQ